MENKSLAVRMFLSRSLLIRLSSRPILWSCLVAWMLREWGKGKGIRNRGVKARSDQISGISLLLRTITIVTDNTRQYRSVTV